LKQLRGEMMGEMNIPYSGSNVGWLEDIRSKLASCEAQYNRLKEATTILELALWKYKMDESGKKKRKRTEETDDFREHCRVGCNADIVIEHVLPFLMPCAG